MAKIDEHVATACEATEEALAELKAWREGRNPKGPQRSSSEIEALRDHAAVLVRDAAQLVCSLNLAVGAQRVQEQIDAHRKKDEVKK